MDSGVPGLLAVDAPAVALAYRYRLHMCGIGAVPGFGDSEGKAALACCHGVDPFGLLGLGPVLEHQEQAHVVAYDRMLVLEIIVKSEAATCQMLANDRHAAIVPIASAVFLGEGIAKVPEVSGFFGL